VLTDRCCPCDIWRAKMKKLKRYTVRKTIRLTRDVYARSALEASRIAEDLGDTDAETFTSGWWCRKDRKGGY